MGTASGRVSDATRGIAEIGDQQLIPGEDSRGKVEGNHSAYRGCESF